MNCQNCGAPLTIAPFSDIAMCAHCGTHHSVPLMEHGSDRIVWTQDQAGMGCPRCHEGLLQVAIEGHSGTACPECHGLLLATFTFGSIVRQRRANYRGEDRIPRPLDLDQLTDPINCPACQRTMEVHPYYGPGNQIIDSCVRCGLVWIDAGELTSIEHAAGSR